MEYVVLPFEKIVPRTPPARDWNHKTYGTILGELIHTFDVNNDFCVFEEYKQIIRNVYHDKNKSTKDEMGIYKISKLMMLKEEFYRDGKFYNPMVATPHGDKYLVHPGRDRFQVLNALGYTEYEFLLCSEDEMEASNIDSLKPHHTDETIFKFNKRNFSIITRVNKTAFENWI